MNAFYLLTYNASSKSTLELRLLVTHKITLWCTNLWVNHSWPKDTFKVLRRPNRGCGIAYLGGAVHSSRSPTPAKCSVTYVTGEAADREASAKKQRCKQLTCTSKIYAESKSQLTSLTHVLQDKSHSHKSFNMRAGTKTRSVPPPNNKHVKKSTNTKANVY